MPELPRPAIDPDYEIDSDIPPRELWENDPDSVFYFDTVVRRVTDTVMTGARGRVLDVGSGDGHQLRTFLRTNRVEVHGLDTSDVLLRRAQRAFAGERVKPGLFAATAESLPFAGGTFDRIVCQGSLDHFERPQAFISEAARALRPGGQLIIALQNFDSASCRISRILYRLRGALGIKRDDPTGAQRPYWQIPANHTFKGNTGVLLRLGRRHLRLERTFGVSMFWLLPSWRRLLGIVPRRATGLLLGAADLAARRAPSMADMIIAVWEKPAAPDARPARPASDALSPAERNRR